MHVVLLIMMNIVGGVDPNGYLAVQHFVTASVQSDKLLIVSQLRSKFGARDIHFHAFYRAWNVSASVFCCIYFIIYADDFYYFVDEQYTKELNVQQIIRLTGKTRRQAMRRLNDLLTRVMETLWPAFEPPALSDSAPLLASGIKSSGRGGGTSTALQDELRKTNKDLRYAVSRTLHYISLSHVF